MRICKVCGNEYLEGSQFCDECGSGVSDATHRESADLAPKGIRRQSSEIPVYRTANVTSVGVPAVEDHVLKDETPSQKADNRQQRIHANLVIERGEAGGTEFTLSADEAYIGRWDADNGIFPDVDLDAYDSEAKVSRKHARIRYADGAYSIEDLGSTNGTYINRGRRLIPGSPQALKNGDEIIVGKIFLRFNVSI